VDFWQRHAPSQKADPVADTRHEGKTGKSISYATEHAAFGKRGSSPEPETGIQALAFSGRNQHTTKQIDTRIPKEGIAVMHGFLGWRRHDRRVGVLKTACLFEKSVTSKGGRRVMFRVLRVLVVGALASTIVAASSNRVEAGNLVENLSGYFGPNTTLNGTALGGSETAFTFTATFDPSAGTVLTTGVAVFATTASIDIAGHGSYTAATDVILADPSYAGAGIYGIGLSDPTGSALFGGIFGAASPAFTVESVVPSTFQSFLEYSNAVVGDLPFTLSLNGGGTLVINDSGNTGATASITAAVAGPVPEPATLIGASQAILLVGLVLRLRRRKD
jgi:hypothetical protein